MIRVFIGYDPVEAVAYNVLQHSIHQRCSRPISFTPIRLSNLNGTFKRPRDPLQSTEFSFSRFLAPHLCDFQGWSLFMDSDILVLDDLAKLWDLRDDRYAVMVVKHNHQPKETSKFLGNTQTSYQKKNWSSVMLFNNARCTALTAEYVNTATGLQLHQFKWLDNDDLIGELPRRWNHLVGYDPPNPDAATVHYTSGGPYFREYKDCEFAREWFAERDSMLQVLDRKAALAKSA
jgi:lipopolysaccharide biosynthesis glycosyltransferase